MFGLSDNDFYNPSLTRIAVVAESTCVFYSSMTVATESQRHCVRATIIRESAGAANTPTTAAVHCIRQVPHLTLPLPIDVLL